MSLSPEEKKNAWSKALEIIIMILTLGFSHILKKRS